MNVAVFCSNYPPHPGGLEVAAYNIAKRLGDRHEVTVVTTAWDGATGVTKEDNVAVHRLPAAHVTETWGLPYPVPTGPGLRAALAAVSSASILHAHGSLYATSLLAAIISRRTAKPFILTEHVGFVQYRRQALNQLQRAAWASIGRYVTASASAATVLNDRVQQWMAKWIPSEHVHFITNGVDVERFRPIDASAKTLMRQQFGLPLTEPLLLFVGRETEKKNLETVLHLPRSNYSLVVCGAKRQIRGDRLIDLGIVPYDRMPALFNAVDMLVQPSSGEGFPLAVQEAMAVALPVVLLWEKGYERTVDPDAVVACADGEAIQRAIDELMPDSECRESIGARARQWAVSKWDWQHTADHYESLMSKAVGAFHKMSKSGSRV